MLAMALILGAALSGCGSSGEEVTSTTAAAAEENTQNTQTADNLTGMEAEFAEGQAHKGGKLTMGETGDVGEFFSPYKQGTLVTYGWAVYEPLAWLSSDGTWTPCLAESWERDDENFTLTVHLRKDVTFSGGEPMTADDVVFSHACRMEYGTASTIGNPASVEKVDDYTVVFTWPSFSLNYEVWVLGQYLGIQLAEVGEGSLDISGSIEAGLEGGSEYFLIEQDRTYDRDPFDSLAISRDNLIRLG